MIRELNTNEVKALHYELILKDIVTVAEKIPPFPDIVWKVVPLIRKSAPLKEIEAVIKYDQVITARVLALSRSPYYARRSDVKSLQDAIILLGGQKLIQVVMTACAAQCYHDKEDSERDGAQRELWEHSVVTALVSEMICRSIKHKKFLTVYTAALLHDIGKTILNRYSKIYLGATLSEVKTGVGGFLEAERSSLGIDHQELGGLIARRWSLPPEVTAAIGNHHCPWKAETDQDVAAIVYVSNRIAATICVDESGSERIALDLERDPVFKRLGASAKVVQKFWGEAKTALAGIAQFLSSER